MREALKKLLRALGIGARGNGGGAHHGGGNGSPPTGAGEGGRPPVEMLSCQDILERLFEYLDGELESPTEIQVEAHLEKCRRCYPRLQFERSFMDALERARAGMEPPRDLRNRVVSVLAEEGLGLG